MTPDALGAEQPAESPAPTSCTRTWQSAGEWAGAIYCESYLTFQREPANVAFRGIGNPFSNGTRNSPADLIGEAGKTYCFVLERWTAVPIKGTNRSIFSRPALKLKPFEDRKRCCCCRDGSK